MVKGFLVLRVLCVAIIFRLTSSEVVQVAIANKSLHRTPDFGYVYFVFHPNSSLEVVNPRQFHAQSYKPCAVTCARNKTCLSFNFGKKPIFFYQEKAQYLCELLSTDKYNSSSKYQSQNPDFDHYSIRSNCSKSPCLYNFTCIANYTEDTYECLCPRPAFEGKNCKDVDECATGQHVCSSNANCSNTIGSYNCTCIDGYYGNGKTCTDVDECATGQHVCSSNANCYNTIGSYNCTCIDGYYGNGKTCTVSVSCTALLSAGYTKDGVYHINPDGQGSFPVYCDMTTHGGGWTVFQRNGKDSLTSFNRGWPEYRTGFGSLTGKFWLGLDKIYRLTKTQVASLRVDLEDENGNKKYAVYSSFSIADESDFYRLHVSGYSGTAGDSIAVAKYKTWINNDRWFSTPDKDNDVSTSGSCAVESNAGWWYGKCSISDLNGGVTWWTFSKTLKNTEMKLK